MQSSNSNMEEALSILNKVNRQRAPEHLHAQIFEKIKQRQIPITWARVAAAALLILCATNIMIWTHTEQVQKKHALNTLITVQNNDWYAE